MNWIKYNINKKENRPPYAGRYLIYRAKCGKMHFEQWNGTGWSSSNNDCTHWCLPSTPEIDKPFINQMPRLILKTLGVK